MIKSQNNVYGFLSSRSIFPLKIISSSALMECFNVPSNLLELRSKWFCSHLFPNLYSSLISSCFRFVVQFSRCFSAFAFLLKLWCTFEIIKCLTILKIFQTRRLRRVLTKSKYTATRKAHCEDCLEDRCWIKILFVCSFVLYINGLDTMFKSYLQGIRVQSVLKSLRKCCIWNFVFNYFAWVLLWCIIFLR